MAKHSMTGSRASAAGGPGAAVDGKCTMQAGSILIIDDNPGLADMWSLVLAERQYDVDVAGRGSEALEKLRARSFNMALVDIHLPDMRGTDLLQDINRIRPDTDCVMVTAHSSLETAVDALNRGAYAYLIKPVEAPELLAVVGRVIERQQLREENRRMMAEVQTAHRILHAVVDSIDSGVLLVGQGGMVHYANRRGVELLNLGEPPAPEDGDSLASGLVAAASGAAGPPGADAARPAPIGGPPGESEWEVPGPERRVLRRYCVPVGWEDGSVIGHVEVYNDITRDKELLERQRHIAEVLQSSILPEVPQHLDGLEIATLYHAAVQHTHVGGDFYDAFPVGKGRVAVLIGDVSGKGLSAAIQTAMTRYALRSYAFEDPDPARVLGRLNRMLYAQGLLESFTTLFYGVLDSTSNSLSYCNAGHERPLLLPPVQEEPIPLDVGGPATGCVGRASYECGFARWLPGSLLLLYTDGATEARRDGEFLEFAGVLRLFRAHASAGSGRLMLDRIYADLEWFSRGVLRDDVALVAICRPAGPA